MDVTNTKKEKKKDREIIKEWGKVPTIAQYSDLSSRKIRNLMKTGEIRYVKLPTGTVLIKLEWIDAYLQSREVRPSAMDHIIESVMKHFEK